MGVSSDIRLNSENDSLSEIETSVDPRYRHFQKEKKRVLEMSRYRTLRTVVGCRPTLSRSHRGGGREAAANITYKYVRHNPESDSGTILTRRLPSPDPQLA
jgi:hypothetical protein